MMKQDKKHLIILAVTIAGAFSLLRAENILKILEGYGRDSIATFSTQDAHSEAAKLFNLLLEENGDVTKEKAEQYLNSSSSNIVRAYLAVILADHAFVNDQYDSGLRYLKRAVDEHDPVRNDSYYRLVLSRAQNNISESPGKTEQGKNTVLNEFNPPAIKASPPVESVKPDTSEAPPPPVPVEEISEAQNNPPADVAVIPNFRIQVGAFSVLDNAQNKGKYFENKGFPVTIDSKQRTSGYLYLVRIGAYDTYDEAKQALEKLKAAYPSEDGIVIKVEK
jgi:cell division septation protein DedD